MSNSLLALARAASLASLSCASLTVWAGSIHHLEGAAFKQIEGDLASISVAFDGTTWGLNRDGYAYRYHPETGRFENNAPDFLRLKQIAVGSASKVWGLTAELMIYRFDGGAQWTHVPGTLRQIAVGADGAVWGINQLSDVYRFVPSSGVFQQVDDPITRLPVKLTAIAVGSSQAVWGLGNVNARTDAFGFEQGYEIKKYDTASGRFTTIGGSLTKISVAGDGDVWGINVNHDVFRFNRATGVFVQPAPGKLDQIVAGGRGGVWGINSQYGVFYFDGTAWPRIPGAALRQIAAGRTQPVGLNVWGIWEPLPNAR